MALTANKADEKTTKEFLNYTGVIPFEVVAFNPDSIKLNELGLNFDAKSPISDDTFNAGHKNYSATFWLRNAKFAYKNGENVVEVEAGAILTSISFYIGDSVAESKTGKTLFINGYGDTIYAESIEYIKDNYEWFDSFKLRGAHKGESDLYLFLRAYANLKYSKNESDENCLENPKQLFEDDTELVEYINGLIKETPKRIVFLLTGFKNTGTDDNGNVKMRQVVYKKFYQKKSQFNSAVSNFTSFINCTRIKKNKEDKIAEREPKMDFYTIEPQGFDYSTICSKLEKTEDVNDDLYSGAEDMF